MTPVKGKGRCRLILIEEFEDEDELHTRAAEILEVAAKNKVSVEEQFKNFIVEEEKHPRENKVKVFTPPKVDSVDLTTNPPLPSPTNIVEEGLPTLTSVTPTNPYLQALPKIFQTKVDKDVDIQEFINQLPNLFSIVQWLNIKKPFVDSGPHNEFSPSPNSLTNHKVL